jgi:hypothetical protein
MGEVYRAHDPPLGRDVALKVLPADMAADPSPLERFTREARAIAALNHPHIVTIYSTEEADGVAAHLTDATSGAQLWTETYDHAGDRLDIYAVQDDVTDRVVSTVADKTGVLARSMVQAVRGIPLDKLSGPELVYRCWGAQLNPSPTGQDELRAALESFLARRPDEPELWAQLSQLALIPASPRRTHCSANRTGCSACTASRRRER